jgi:hypothetical protein
MVQLFALRPQRRLTILRNLTDDLNLCGSQIARWGTPYMKWPRYLVHR